MPIKQPLLEVNKRPGVFYALTPDGLELPVIDVTNPVFALSITPAQQAELVHAFVKERQQFERVPKFIRNLLLRIVLRGSALGRGIRQSKNSYLSGTDTYLLKLGPEMLGNAYTKPIDRKIAASAPSIGVRLRMQDVARMLADCLAHALSCDSQRPLHFLNIAGGPAIDSLNALILLNKESPDLLAQRKISIDALDLDDAGPKFGEAALQAISQSGGPLRGLHCTFRHIRYDWAKADDLQLVLVQRRSSNALAICSSEGGLFEYGPDQEIVENLKVLRRSGVIAVVGSVTRADEPTRMLHQDGGAAVICRGLAVFRALVEGTGWKIARVVERPFSDQIVLM